MKFNQFETEELEYEKSTGELKEAIVSLSAMLNKHKHGVVLFGVSNDGTVIGQDIGESTARDISEAIAHHLKPEVIPEISIIYEDGKYYIRVEVSGNEIPYSAYNAYYIRSADEDRDLSPAQLKRLMLMTIPNLLTVEASSKQDLTFDQLKTLYSIRHIPINEENFCENLNLLTADGRYNLLAYMLADYNSISIKVSRFLGTDKTYLGNKREFGNMCILLAAETAYRDVEGKNFDYVDMSGLQRVDTPLFRSDVLREAWYNACLHSRWYKMVPPYMEIYDDRIEIVSEGGLPEGMTEDDFYKGVSRPVNPELQMIMGQLGYVEQTGHGVPLIVSAYGKEAFTITDNFITVTIPFARKYRGDYAVEQSSGNEIKVSSLQDQIIKLIEDDPSLTAGKISERCGVDRHKVSNTMYMMTKEGIIAREGSKKTGTWKILKGNFAS